MKHVLLAIFCFVCTAKISAQVVDTLVYDSWETNDWQPQFRNINNYNADCQVATTLSQLWDTTSQTWINAELVTNTYVAVSHVSETITQYWDEGASSWINASRQTFTYNASYQKTVSLAEIWYSGAWLSYSRTTNTYDGSGYLVSTLDEISDLVTNTWKNSALETYTNNSDGTVNNSVQQSWNSTTSAWDNDSRDTYTYNSNKTPSQIVYALWDATSSNWADSERTTLTYNAAGSPITTLGESWETTLWVNDYLGTTTYDANNHPTNYLGQDWDTTASAWVNDSQFNITYNGDGTVHQETVQDWDTTASAWANQARLTYHYTSSCLLPLTLLSFDATRKDNTVLLNWKTSNEVNTSHFTIQRSTNATTFTSLGNVPAKGNGGVAVNNYGYTDDISGIQSQKLYYRLQMADNDGKVVLSKIVSVNLADNKIEFTVKPNPARSYFVLTPQVSGSGSFINAVMKVTTLSGRVVIRQNIVSGGEQKIDISTLPKGIYMISLITGKNVKTQKLVVE